jgi:hypothetical protein
MNSIEESDHISELIDKNEPLLFDAYIGFNPIIEKIPSLLRFYPRVVIIIILEDLSFFHVNLSEYIGQNVFCIDPKTNVLKKVSKILKIKHWNLDNFDRQKVDTSIVKSVIKTKITNKYKYLEHDVNPWVIPIENISKFLPNDSSENEIMPIANHIADRIDDFNEFDSNFWKILEDTFPSNQSQFTKENFKLSSQFNSGFQLEVTNMSKGSKKYSSSSIVSRVQYLYGSFEISIKPIKGDGIISAFFLHRNDPWQEIDIEFLGNDTSKILLNVYYNPGISNTKYNYGVRGTPVLIDLGFDAADDFHSYRIEWEYHEIRWYVDNKIIHVRKTWSPTPIPNLSMFIYVNTWITNSEELAGKFNQKTLPKTSFIKHIKLSEFDYTKIS